ncbi:MAG TPA: PH domain-containing protein [Leptospiraceae bacterium]|nr:PH domain-containing protein [Leptospiraceae bacterium]HMY65555.1 PH domain-containing protein [Leptospiraceae bacterium]HNI25489.1 PH domain-containing protein [Leptospiraceae bacterium]HNM02911.1 PH domain-containing protein [Leptospiraceae bacterium]HNN02256.1 PH domain-containing protein [Leptospiraceae bacterium]
MTANELLYLIAGFLAGFFIRHYMHEFIKEPVLEPQSDGAVTAEGGETAVPPPEIMIRKIFQASRLGDPVTPDEVIFDAKGVTFNVKRIFESTETYIPYSKISGVEVFESFILASVKIKQLQGTEIKIENFRKDDAKQIKKFILEKLV